jgi:hypothetical protein
MPDAMYIASGIETPTGDHENCLLVQLYYIS